MDAIPPGTFGPSSTPQPVVVGMIGTAGTDERPAKMMSFTDAFRTCMVTKYFAFQGRASRSEFWWFQLGLLGISILAGFLDDALGIDLFESAVLAGGGVISDVVMLVTIIPIPSGHLPSTSRQRSERIQAPVRAHSIDWGHPFARMADLSRRGHAQ